MNKFLMGLVVSLGLMFSQASFAENRLVGGYNFGSDVESSFSGKAELNVFGIGESDVYVTGTGTRVLGGSASDTVWSTGVGIDVPITDNLFVKVQYNYNFATESENFNTYVLGGYYHGDLWRFSSAMVSTSGRETFYQGSAERKIYENLALGVGTSFNGDYLGTQLFAVVTW